MWAEQQHVAAHKSFYYHPLSLPFDIKFAMFNTPTEDSSI